MNQTSATLLSERRFAAYHRRVGARLRPRRPERKVGEDAFMERRAFLKFMIAGAGAAAVAASSDALALTTLPAPAPSAAPDPDVAVATPADLEQAKIEKAQWGYRRRYWGRPYWGPRPYWRRRYFWGPRRWRRRRYYY